MAGIAAKLAELVSLQSCDRRIGLTKNPRNSGVFCLRRARLTEKRPNLLKVCLGQPRLTKPTLGFCRDMIDCASGCRKVAGRRCRGADYSRPRPGRSAPGPGPLAQWPEDLDEPSPVSARTCWALNAARSSVARALRSVTENSQMLKKATVMENSAGEV